MSPLQRVILRELQKHADIGMFNPPTEAAQLPPAIAAPGVRKILQNKATGQATPPPIDAGVRPIPVNRNTGEALPRAIKTDLKPIGAPAADSVQSAIQSTSAPRALNIQPVPKAVAPTAAPRALNKLPVPSSITGALSQGANLAGGLPMAFEGLTHTDEQGKWDPSYLNTGLGAGLTAYAGRQLARSGLRGITPGNLTQTGLGALKSVGARGLIRGGVRGVGSAALGAGALDSLSYLTARDAQGNLAPQWTNAAGSLAVGAAPYAASRILTKAAPIAGGFLGRALPIAGAGILANQAAEQIRSGNYLGGALNAGAALTSAVPPVSFALQGGAALTDIYGNAQRAYQRAGQLQQANQQMLSNEAAGRSQPASANAQYLTPSGVQG
jgi:hypothetical protein